VGGNLQKSGESTTVVHWRATEVEIQDNTAKQRRLCCKEPGTRDERTRFQVSYITPVDDFLLPIVELWGEKSSDDAVPKLWRKLRWQHESR
jgi:hypothetical protein